jgi:hypothetical protein
MIGVLYVPEAQQGTVTKKATNTTAGNYTLFTSENVTVSNAASVVVKVLLGDAASRTV